MAKKDSSQRNQAIGILILALIVAALFVIVATIPQRTTPQTGAVITGGQVQPQVTNVSKPLTTLRVVYTKS